MYVNYIDASDRAVVLMQLAFGLSGIRCLNWAGAAEEPELLRFSHNSNIQTLIGSLDKPYLTQRRIQNITCSISAAMKEYKRYCLSLRRYREYPLEECEQGVSFIVMYDERDI